ncbi:uncharacterized protein LOC123561640 [Mercenaria mercenaria]|uniref:uncharacterized protein LOC123561640 n=1 Tax=Mercenaria mercenaria TaxID=6596 RepID=UPI00234F0238|nr:uncharacterized protein LOC123561640 [Mercenaria mercenaria]
MAQARRTNSRNSLLTENGSNRSNSNKAGSRRSTPSEKENFNLKKQSSSSTLKILGQDDEVSEDVLWNGLQSDRNTPTSSRSSVGSRPGSTSRRTPTPSKQISLQAVRRKEDKIEPLESIDWNEIDKPTRPDERLPPLPMPDSDSDSLSPRDTPMSAEEQLALVEQRTRQMTSALSTCRMDEQEKNLSRQLDQIETAREERERKLKEKLESHRRTPDHRLTVEDGQFTYRNDHFRDLSKRDHRDKIDSDFILAGMGTSNDNVLKAGSQPQKRKGENVIGRHAMDKNQETAVGAGTQDEKTGQNESDKKDEASAETSSEEESDDEEEDLIGEKGKAPNALLMEFLTCMMEEDYENSEKLCKMILIYEPENQEALSFFPLIQEKLRQEEEEEEMMMMRILVMKVMILVKKKTVMKMMMKMMMMMMKRAPTVQTVSQLPMQILV